MCDNLGIRVVLGGVVKNVENHFSTIQNFINSLKNIIPSLEVCIYENNSIDNTKQLLNKLHEMMPFVQIQCKDYSEEYYLDRFPGRAFDNTSCRMHKIACARNELLKMIEHKNLGVRDFVIMMDLDINIAPDVNMLKGIIDNWYPDLHVLFANGIDHARNYYDAYALRTSEYPYGPEILGEEFWSDSHMANLKKPVKDLVPVLSAFGGLAIYKAIVIKGCQYSADITNELHELYSGLEIQDKSPQTHYNGCALGIYKDKIFYKNNSGYNYPVIVEHSSFHLSIRKKGYKNMFICPYLYYYWI